MQKEILQPYNLDATMEPIRLVTVLFKNEISSEEISFFRGSIILLSGNDPLFHNHSTQGFNYTYPLVQYKRIDGCAAIVGINQGGYALEQLFENECSFSCQLGGRNVKMELSTIRIEEMFVRLDEFLYTYSIQRWLPLNSNNFREYQQTEELVSRIRMLEKILVGNILSLAKGIGIHFGSTVICQILQLEEQGYNLYKNVKLKSFSAVFRTNLILPDYIGLGKSVSINHGVITRIK